MTTATAIRGEFVTIGNVLDQHASLMDYSEEPDRDEIFDLTWPQAQVRLDSGESLTGDCSSTWEAVREWAGCINLPPLGWTGSELDDPNMPHIPLAAGLNGDGIVIGEYPGKHVVWIAEPHPTNPMTYGHGEPGFTEIRLLELMATVFPGLPYTVLSIAHYLPPAPPADPYHYAWYDPTQVHGLPHGETSEQAEVKLYDELRLAPQKNKDALIPVVENLIVFAQRIENNERTDNDPKGLKDHRAFRHEWIVKRISGLQVAK